MPTDAQRQEDRGLLLRSFMRKMAQSVTVVATNYNNTFHGITVSSVTSASLNPPLMLICIEKSSNSREAIIGSGAFTINLLAQEQSDLSDVFAGRPHVQDKFQAARFFLTDSGLPVIKGTVGYLECKVWRTHDAGDHDLILGEVSDGFVGSRLPLLYHDQSYTTQGYNCPACGRPFTMAPE